MRKTFFQLAVFFFYALACFGDTYNMEDLEALEASKNFKEFFLHARDIRPAQRNTYWKKVVSSMAQEWFQVLSKSAYIDQKEAALALRAGLWSELSGDDVLKERRDRFVFKFFQQCPERETGPRKECVSLMAEYWSKGGTPEVLAKLVPVVDLLEQKEELEGRTLPFGAWDFFLPLAKTDLSEFYCDKPIYQKLLWQNLIEKEGQEAEFDRLHQDCWAKFRPYLLDELASSRPVEFERVLGVLTKKKELQGELRDWPFFFYLLKGKWGNAEISLTSLEKLSSLAALPQVREQIINKIESIPFIPDDILAESTPVNKKHEFLQRTQENFPEFFDLYSRSCLDYLEGKKIFKKGNPTLHCREVFSWAKGHKLKKIFSEQSWLRMNKLSM